MYELIIIGGGPAGITAGIYAARKKIKTLLVTTDFIGQVGLSGKIENWPGEASIKGTELIEQFEDHLRRYDIDVIEDSVVSIKAEANGGFRVKADDGGPYAAQSILLATGGISKRLDIPGEAKFIGRGVVYCTTCDAPVYQDKKVIVVGGGNTGFSSAIELTDYAREVTLFEATDIITADEVLQEKAKIRGISILKNQTITKINGGDYVTGVTLQDGSEMSADGVFIEIGYTPSSTLAPVSVKKNNSNEIIINPKTCATNVRGFYAAGDVTNVKIKQIVNATAEGAKAALSIYKYLRP